MEFLSKLDPNLVAVLFTAITTVGGWLYRKAKGEKQADITDALWDALEGKVIALAESEEVAGVVRDKLTKAAYEALARMGLKKNAVVDTIVAKLVERGVTEVRKRVLARKNAEAAAQLPAQIQALLELAAKLPKTFDAPPPEKRTVPTLLEGLPGEVARICPEAGCDRPLGHEGEHGAVAEPAQ